MPVKEHSSSLVFFNSESFALYPNIIVSVFVIFVNYISIAHVKIDYFENVYPHQKLESKLEVVLIFPLSFQLFFRRVREVP